MEKKALFSGISIHRGQFFLIFFLIFNAFIWFSATSFVIRDEPFFWLFPAATLIALLAGPLIAEKVSRRRFLLFWVLIGIISSLLYPILLTFGGKGSAILLVLWGLAFGIGFPSCLALMATLTRIEERGRIGGIIFFITWVILPFSSLAIESLDVFSRSLFLTAWRGLSLLPLFLLKVDLDTPDVPSKPVSYLSILSRRQFLFYFFPWLVFYLINQLENPIFEQTLGVGVWETLMVAGGLIISFFCLISGWLMDFKGRRWTILVGFVTLGLGYAALGFFPHVLMVQILFVVLDSITWGIFAVAFGLVIWGDMANHQRAEKFYGLGNVPASLALVLAAFASTWLRTLDPSKAFPLASFFLFLAVIPIFFAPELLPEKVVKERELKKYMEEAKKIAGRE
jgi:hypothetical protein